MPTVYRCPICEKLIEPAREQYTYAIVDGRSCRFDLKPEALRGSERAYQVHDVCADALKQRVENGEPVISER